MELNINQDFFQKEEWIDTIKYISPRSRYNHIELQGEVYLQLKQYFKRKCNVSIEASLFLAKEDPKKIGFFKPHKIGGQGHNRESFK